MEDNMTAKEEYLKKYESDIAAFTSHINEKIVADGLKLKNKIDEQCQSDNDEMKEKMVDECNTQKV